MSLADIGYQIKIKYFTTFKIELHCYSQKTGNERKQNPKIKSNNDNQRK